MYSRRCPKYHSKLLFKYRVGSKSFHYFIKDGKKIGLPRFAINRYPWETGNVPSAITLGLSAKAGLSAEAGKHSRAGGLNFRNQF